MEVCVLSSAVLVVNAESESRLNGAQNTKWQKVWFSWRHLDCIILFTLLLEWFRRLVTRAASKCLTDCLSWQIMFYFRSQIKIFFFKAPMIFFISKKFDFTSHFIHHPYILYIYTTTSMPSNLLPHLSLYLLNCSVCQSNVSSCTWDSTPPATSCQPQEHACVRQLHGPWLCCRNLTFKLSRK